MTTSAVHHPFSELGMRNPYPVLAAFRRLRPAFFDQGLGMWLLTSHELCRVALRSPAFSAAQGQQQRVRADDLPISMLNTDGDLHARLRSPAAAAFSARASARQAGELRSVARDILATLPPAGSGEIDMVAQLATPYAGAVLGLTIGLPRPLWPALGAVARPASANLNPVLRGGAATAATQAALDLHAFLVEYAPDVVGTDGGLTAGERLGILSLIVVGGYEPLADLCSTALSLLLDTPGALDRLRGAAPEAFASAVDEAMRLESPIGFTSRVCVDGYRTDTVDIPAGAPVLAMLGAANRDPAVFDDPDSFRPDRRPNAHLALGGGVHHCLGAAIVKQSCAALLEELVWLRPGVRRQPGTRSPWRPTLVPRGLARLPICW